MSDFHNPKTTGGAWTTLLMLVLMSVTNGVASRFASAQECDPVETHMIPAPDGSGADSFFGWSVAIDGDVVAVGGYRTGRDFMRTGSVTVGRPGGFPWVADQVLTASDGDAEDYFGDSVSVSGNVLIVGAIGDDDWGFNSGSAYIFRHDGSSWVEEQKLTASDGASTDYFGSAVAIRGDLAFVGAYGDDDSGSWAGSVYVYRWDGTSWIEDQKLLPDSSDAREYFGSSISLGSDTVLIGAHGADDRGNNSGAAYAFRWDGSSFVEEQKILASDGGAEDEFGCAVSLSGDRALVGARYDDDSNENAGAAYVFRWNGTAWEEEQKLLASGGAVWGHLGFSVALDDDVALVGAPQAGYLESGTVHLYHWDGSSWIEQLPALTASDQSPQDWFGDSLAVRGNTAVVGASGWEMWTGSAYLFDLGCPQPLSLQVAGACPGPMRFEASGATPGERVAFLYARGTGSFEIPPGNPCAGTTLGLDATAMLARIVPVDSFGVARLEAQVPAAACGRVHVQVLDLATCSTSNVVGL